MEEHALPAPTGEEALGMTKIPQRLWAAVDLERYWEEVEAPNPDVEPVMATTYVAKFLANYIERDIADGELLGEYVQDFAGWDEAMFQRVHSEYAKELKATLRFKGIYTGRINMSPNEALYNLLALEECPKWPEASFPSTKFDERSSAYMMQQRLLSGPQTRSNTPRREPDSGRASVRGSPPRQPLPRTPLGEPVPTIEPTVQPRTLPQHLRTNLQEPIPIRINREYAGRQHSEYHDGPRRQTERPEYPQPPRESIPPFPRPTTDDPYEVIPPIPYQNMQVDVTAITTFVKIWDKAENYTGQPYDLLDDKIKVFYNICEHARIEPGQFHAVFPRILSDKANQYYLHYVQKADTFSVIYAKLKAHFDTEVNHSSYYTDWTTTNFRKVRRENPESTMQQCLELMLDKLQLCQRALGAQYAGEFALRTTVITACRGVPELEMALFKPPISCEELFGDLRSSIETHLARITTSDANIQMDDQYYLDRRYNNPGRGRGSKPTSRSSSRGHFGGRQGAGRSRMEQRNPVTGFADKKCFVCQKIGCWSTNHTLEERAQAKAQYLSICEFNGSEPDHGAYLVAYEGEDPNLDYDEIEADEARAAVGYLQNAAFLHQLTTTDVYRTKTSNAEDVFLIEDRYTRQVYQGILPDSGAANMSTVGKDQFLALQKEDPDIRLDTSTAGHAQIKFGRGEVTGSIGTTRVATELGDIVFHVLEAPTPFLLCLADMDKLNVYYNNVTNELVQGAKKHPVVRKWGHPWFHLSKTERSYAFLTEGELRRLHRRFGHPSTDRLAKVLDRAGHEADRDTMQAIREFCHHCQTHTNAPHRFKFTLKDDRDFNYEVIVDVMYLSNKPVLHVVDSSTAFGAARFLPSMSAKDTWEALRMLWIDTYQGPPDIITHDAGTNFAAAEFKAEARTMGITCKQVPIEAHWSIGKLERYHAPLKRAYEILTAEIGNTTSQEARLQMAVKAVNDTAGPDGLVPTLLVFGAYPRMTMESPPSPTMIQRSQAIQRAMRELRKLAAKRQIADALGTRNGPSTEDVLSLPIGSESLVWREKEGWAGPYKVLNTQGHNVTVDMVNGPTTFRSTTVKPYRRREEPVQDEPEEDRLIAPEPQEQPRRRGRPPGAKNKVRTSQYLTRKEEDDMTLAVKLRNDGVINVGGKPFEESDATEVNDLIGRGVFIFELYDQQTHSGRIFKSRMVREVKGKDTKPYEKSRLVIQGYNDQGKTEILTQSPTIQRASQRLLMAIAPALMETGMVLQLRDITQAYPQAQTELYRTILAELPRELKTKYPEGTLIRVIKPLYGIPEAGVHWFTTYHKHHREKIGMITSTYDPCLLITNSGSETFGIVGMQTDDTLMLGTMTFIDIEEQALAEAGFRAKPKSQLAENAPLDFNGCTLTIEGTTLNLKQKGQGKKIDTILMNATDRAQTYMEQRARGAYVASICQPEASFDLSVAAQAQQPTEADITALNKRLQWQAENLDRGLKYVPVDLSTAKLMVFADGSFANNADLSSQLGFMIVLVNEEQEGDAFRMRGNLIHWSSTKCKRVTRSVLASEIYGVVNGFDIGIAIATTLRLVTEQLGIPTIPVIVCTDSYSLYECLVKLSTTSEKRLMIDLMALRESYERREIAEIRWINGEDNPADAFTKTKSNKTLERFIDDNELLIRVEGSVRRPTK